MIVITTPAGHIGRQVLGNLPRVEVIEGSHGDPAVADNAFDGVDAVFWLTPPDPRAETVEAAYVG